MKRSPQARAILALSLAMYSCAPWTVRPIDGDTGTSAQTAAIANPAAYADSIWATKLLPAVSGGAVDARTLLDALSHSPEQAQARYGRREAKGPVYFLLKGQGRITRVDRRSKAGLALVDIAPFDGRPDVSIQIGPVIRGTSLRDAAGLVHFSDFVNQLQFADVGNELNARAWKTVLAPLEGKALEHATVSFAGTLAAETGVEPPLRDLVPVQLSIEDRR